MSMKSIDEYVNINKKILKLVGLYPVNYVRYFICLFSMLLIVVPQVFQLYLNRKDLSVVLETSSVLSTILLAILKSFVWLWSPETPLIVEYFLADYWRTAQFFDDNNHMHGYAKAGRNVTRGYSFLIVNALLVFFTLQPVNHVFSKLRGNNINDKDSERSFPFPAIYPKFCYDSPFYELTYASQMLATGICGLVILAMDTLIACALFHTSGHFKILRENLLNLDYYFNLIEEAEAARIRNRTKYTNQMSRFIRKKLALFIDHHRLVIRFSDTVEKAFNPIMLLQVFASSLIICLVGFQVSAMTSGNNRLVEYSSYLLMALFQVLLFCWPGGEMMFESSMVGQAAFSMNWYKASKDVKMEVYFIILRSQKPSCLTAGKLYAMSMKSFSAILNTSLSYFTLLRSFNAE